MKAVNDVKLICYRMQIIKKKFTTQHATNITTNNIQVQDVYSTQIKTKNRLTKPIAVMYYRIQLFL